VNGNSIVVDAAMALSVAVLSYFLYHLVQHRTAAEKAGKHVSHLPDLLRHPSRAVRIATAVYGVLLIGFFLVMDVRGLHRWSHWLSHMPAESRGLLARALAMDFGLVAVAFALVFGVGALAMWVMRRVGKGGHA
jgi:hypothetical protein